MSRIKFLHLWSIAVGAMDAITGLLLVVSPTLLLRWLQVPPFDLTALVFLSWMGVFIGSVGLSYGLVLRGNREGETVWIFTGTIRTLVAIFVIMKIIVGELPMPWALVAATDGMVAIGQFVLLRAGWWKGGEG